MTLAKKAFSVSLKGNVRNFQKLKEHKAFDKILHYTKTFYLKNPFLYVFSKLYFCCFTFKNTPSCSLELEYFKSSDLIIVKKKSLLKHSLFYVHLVLKKDKMVAERLDV